MLASVDVNTHDYDYDISSKHDKKVCRLFALGIISDAITAGWENEELARVIVLFTRKLHLSTKKTLAFIQACELKSVAIIAAIEDEGLILTTRNKIKTMLRWQNYDLDGFIAMMNDALELSVLYSNDMEVSVIVSPSNSNLLVDIDIISIDVIDKGLKLGHDRTPTVSITVLVMQSLWFKAFLWQNIELFHCRYGT